MTNIKPSKFLFKKESIVKPFQAGSTVGFYVYHIYLGFWVWRAGSKERAVEATYEDLVANR